MGSLCCTPLRTFLSFTTPSRMLWTTCLRANPSKTPRMTSITHSPLCSYLPFLSTSLSASALTCSHSNSIQCSPHSESSYSNLNLSTPLSYLSSLCKSSPPTALCNRCSRKLSQTLATLVPARTSSQEMECLLCGTNVKESPQCKPYSKFICLMNSYALLNPRSLLESCFLTLRIFLDLLSSPKASFCAQDDFFARNKTSRTSWNRVSFWKTICTLVFFHLLCWSKVFWTYHTFFCFMV